ncbi:MAG TPA: hypothetical protein VFO16_19900 [Pseudonocardiaceae bacterium]|nr:hypothetical protein [Pseudonocardiaceae bacterium]
MMNKEPRARWRRAITVLGLAAPAVAVLAAPAFAHPVFSNDAPGFPNPMGGTGGTGQTPPYPAGSRPTLNMYLPFEQDGVVFHGAENTTVDVRVTIPKDWASPACGPVRASPPVGYRQLGTEVPGWSCAVEAVSGHQVLHWSGPQIGSAQTHDDSAQFFTFQATMPSPSATTSYGAKDGPEGIHVKQVYADGTTLLWTPPNDPSAGVIANGVVRTVAGATAPPPTPAPTPGAATQGGTTGSGTTQGGTTRSGAMPSGSPPPEQSGDAVTPPPPDTPAGPTTLASPPPADEPISPEVTPAESTPGAVPQSHPVEQLIQHDSATARGAGWGVWVGIALGLLLVAGTVIVVIKRRRGVS